LRHLSQVAAKFCWQPGRSPAVREGHRRDFRRKKDIPRPGDGLNEHKPRRAMVVKPRFDRQAIVETRRRDIVGLDPANGEDHTLLGLQPALIDAQIAHPLGPRSPGQSDLFDG